MSTIPSPRCRNLYLASLPEEEFNRLKPHLEKLEMKIGEVIHKPNELSNYVFFPENAVISLVTFLEDGWNIETGIVGNEGVGGISIILSDQPSLREATIQVPGACWRMSVKSFKEELEKGGEIKRMALRFVFAFIEQVSQNAACTSRHRIEARLARWLLTLDDRIAGKDIRITQEFIAQMLGAHRPSVTENAIKLQEKGLISYTRGQIKILDRPGLEKVSCECYEVIKNSFHKYLNNVDLKIK